MGRSKLKLRPNSSPEQGELVYDGEIVLTTNLTKSHLWSGFSEDRGVIDTLPDVHQISIHF